MMEFVSDFISDQDRAAIIKVVGVGGGGCNAVNGGRTDVGRYLYCRKYRQTGSCKVQGRGEDTDW